MPTDPALIQLLLSEFQTPNLGSLSSAAMNDRYEAFVWLLAIRAAREEGATVSLQTAGGQPVNAPVLRSSPGVISSPNLDFTHAVISFPGRPVLEAHLGIKLDGKSGVAHEADVAVLEQSEANLCRDNGVNPRYSSALIVVECKYYSTPLPLGLSRSFLGLCREMRAADCFFVANREALNVSKVLSYGRFNHRTLVLPSSMPSTNLLHQFQTKYSQFKAL
jgi:hypothetical protein